MTLGVPTFSWNIFPAGLTEVGVPLYEDDSWNPAAALSGVNPINTMGLLVGEPVIDSSDGSSHTIKVVFKADSSGTIQVFLSQIEFGPTKLSLVVGLSAAGQVTCQFWTTNSTLSHATSTPSYADGEEHIVIIAIAATQIDMYVDGVDLALNTLGDAYTGMAASTPNATIGGRDEAPPTQNMLVGTRVSRIQVWATEAADSTEAGELYDSEIASQGEGFNAAPTGTINSIVQRT